ncbi:hypothetical protein DY000_02004554 [Brassica cretica]|uniref:Amine oxidase domain-containing protein n=1 Tax=Brassica cretica TaxID=69181 RepID=A0ABQ7BSG0_BRACR|nr:hypothetical protein DY000_02004554 [Brassica cretica]
MDNNISVPHDLPEGTISALLQKQNNVVQPSIIVIGLVVIHTDYSFACHVDMGASWLHGVSNDNPLAPIIRRLGLSLYHTSGDDSFLYDHDLQRDETASDMSVLQGISIVLERNPELRQEGMAYQVLHRGVKWAGRPMVAHVHIQTGLIWTNLFFPLVFIGQNVGDH